MRRSTEERIRGIIRQELRAHDNKNAMIARFDGATVSSTGLPEGTVSLVPSAAGFGAALNDGLHQGFSSKGVGLGRDWFKRWFGA